MIRRLFLLSLSISVICFFLTPSPVSAEGVSVIPFPIAQRFSPADSTGDDGTYNCMAASLIIALQTIQVEKDRKISPSITYEMLRKTIREHVGYKQGIPPYILAETITFFTNGTVSFHMLQVTDKSWDAYLTKELSLGYPLIVHMSDRDMLFQKKLPEDASHVIVVYGIDDTYVYFSDSWDGKTHRVFKEDFAEAWGGGKYPWWAFPLRFSEATL